MINGCCVNDALELLPRAGLKALIGSRLVIVESKENPQVESVQNRTSSILIIRLFDTLIALLTKISRCNVGSGSTCGSHVGLLVSH